MRVKLQLILQTEKPAREFKSGKREIIEFASQILLAGFKQNKSSDGNMSIQTGENLL